jgi:hypothetical protein
MNIVGIPCISGRWCYRFAGLVRSSHEVEARELEHTANSGRGGDEQGKGDPSAGRDQYIVHYPKNASHIFDA